MTQKLDTSAEAVEPTDPGPTLADAYRAGLKAAAQRAYDKLYPRSDQSDWTERAKIRANAAIEVSAIIRALEVPDDFGGE